MKHGRFSKGQRIILGEREYIIDQALQSGKLKLQDISNNTYLSRSREELIDALFSGQMVMVVENPTRYVRKKASEMLSADFVQFGEKEKKEAKRRYSYVTAVVEDKLDRKTKKALQPLIQVVSKTINDANPPSAISVYRWCRDFIASGENIRSLLSLQDKKGNYERRLPKEVIDIIEKGIDEKYLTQQRNSAQSTYDAIVARITHENELRDPGDRMQIPAQKAVYRAIKKLDPYEVMKERYGKRMADLKFRPKGQGVRPTRPLERIEIDHTKLDLFVVDFERNLPIGRPWLTTAIDVYTKCIVGFYISFNPPSFLSVMQCMRHAIRSKSYVKKKYPKILNSWDAYGVMETAVVDNGKEFYSADFEDACLQLGIVIQYTPVRLAWYKPSVERYFRTLNMGLLHKQPGTTFSNIFDKGDYDPVKNAVIDLNTLLELVHTWIIDVYHQNFHRGIREVPAKLWKKAIEEFPPALPCKSSELDALIGMVESRVISAAGIELNGLFYNDDALVALRRENRTDGRKVKVKFDPTDLGAIYVLDEDAKTFITVQAANYAYANGLTLWQHRVIRNFAQKQFGKDDIISLALAKERVQQIVENYLANSKKRGSHQKAARWLNLSQDNYGQIIDEKEESKETAITYEKPIALPIAEHNPANCISDIGKSVFADSEAIGEIVTEASAVKTKKKVREFKRPKKKEAAGIAARITAQRKKALQPHSNNDEDSELDMDGYGATYSLSKNK